MKWLVVNQLFRLWLMPAWKAIRHASLALRFIYRVLITLGSFFIIRNLRIGKSFVRTPFLIRVSAVCSRPRSHSDLVLLLLVVFFLGFRWLELPGLRCLEQLVTSIGRLLALLRLLLAFLFTHFLSLNYFILKLVNIYHDYPRFQRRIPNWISFNSNDDAESPNSNGNHSLCFDKPFNSRSSWTWHGVHVRQHVRSFCSSRSQQRAWLIIVAF